MLCSLLALCVVSAIVQVNGADPINDIENDFDIIGQDLNYVKGTINQCYHHCRLQSGCVAWAHNDYDGGTCWLKYRADIIVAKKGVSIGRLMIESNKGKLYKDVDFVGNDITSALAPNASDCVDICRSTFGCRAFSWNDYQSGTCWLKGSRTKVEAKTGIVSADVYSHSWPFGKPVLVYRDLGKVELRGNFVGGRDGESCSDVCRRYGEGFCVGYTEIHMHHTFCQAYYRVTDVVSTANPYGNSWVLATPEN